jgi:hypothetical protein
MRIKKANSAEDHKLFSSFQAIRKTLLKEKFSDRREKPLAYWALPNDRRLPLALLGRTIDELLATQFEDLAATPGIGQKKISTFVKLLHRAVEDEPTVPFGIQELDDDEAAGRLPADATAFEPFDSASVSEAAWARWRQTVRSHGLGSLPLGRLAPSLRELPTVIWHKPIRDYLDHSVAEIRAMKTHGEKRVRVVLQVFSFIHAALAEACVADHLHVNLVPRFTAPMDRWVLQALGRGPLPDAKSLRTHLTEPLLDQLLIDAGETVHALAAGRLAREGASESVRVQAQRLKVTRARVYQLLEECGQVMSVRWPEGRIPLGALTARLDRERADAGTRALLGAARELFFPEKTEANNNGQP